MLSPELLIAIALTFVAAGFVKGAIGLGLPTVTLALLTLPLGLKPTLGILVIPLLVTNAWQALQGGYLKELIRRLWQFLAAAVITVYAGVQVLASARSEVLVAVLGVILVVNSIISFTRFRIPPPRPERERAWSVSCGGLGGIMFGMTGNFITLVVKGMMDALAAFAFARTFGVSVIFSALPVLAIQRHDRRSTGRAPRPSRTPEYLGISSPRSTVRSLRPVSFSNSSRKGKPIKPPRYVSSLTALAKPLSTMSPFNSFE